MSSDILAGCVDRVCVLVPDVNLKAASSARCLFNGGERGGERGVRGEVIGEGGEGRGERGGVRGE